MHDKKQVLKTVILTLQISIFYLIATLFSSCGKLPGFSVGKNQATFVQEEVIDPTVDLLFVIDNSGSMIEEQTNLANNFSTFINEFSTRNLDFHVGIISTDNLTYTQASSNGYPNWWSVSGSGGWGNSYAGIYNGGPGGLLSTSSSLTFLDPTLGAGVYIPQFQANVQLGADGNGAETPLLAIEKAIDPSQTATGQRNENFFRSDAGLAIIIVSDEDESVSALSSNYIRNNSSAETARLDTLETELVTFKNNDRNLVSVNVITNPSSGACADSWDVGETLVKFATRFDGVIANICDDFASSLDNIGENILSLLTRFELPQPVVNLEQVVVKVDGSTVVQDDVDGWSYIVDNSGSSTRYFIQFNGSSIPPAGASISVNYTPGAPA